MRQHGFRAPQQRRSRAMVRRIIDAAEYVLIAHGYAGASTNRIAHTAGISPGSLYRYFPNKDALVVAVIDRYRDEVVAILRRRALDNLARSPDIAVPAMISALLDALQDRPELLRAVVEQTPRLDTDGAYSAFDQQITEVARTILRAHSDSPATAIDPIGAEWMLVRTVQHATIRYILDRPTMARDHFIDGLTRVVHNLLRH